MTPGTVNCTRQIQNFGDIHHTVLASASVPFAIVILVIRKSKRKSKSCSLYITTKRFGSKVAESHQVALATDSTRDCTYGDIN